MFDRTVFFRLVGWVGTLGELRSKSPIVEPIHPLFERDRAKKDYGWLPTRAESGAFDRGKLRLNYGRKSKLALTARSGGNLTD